MIIDEKRSNETIEIGRTAFRHPEELHSTIIESMIKEN